MKGFAKAMAVAACAVMLSSSGAVAGDMKRDHRLHEVGNVLVSIVLLPVRLIEKHCKR